MTHSKHLLTEFDSLVRAATMEDCVCKEVTRLPSNLWASYAGAIAAEALTRMEAEFQGLSPNQNPYIWIIGSTERQLVEALTKEHAPDAPVVRCAQFVVEQLSGDCTCDELASGAVNAAMYYRGR
jgi:hypothetical protein